MTSDLRRALCALTLIGLPTPAVHAAETVLVPKGAEWNYLDDGSDQGIAWQAPGFPDGTWASGLAQLGYGDGDEVTVVGFGPNPSDKHITTYFRHSFAVGDLGEITGAMLRILRDDGAVVYLNGVEVVRTNLPDGPIDFETVAPEIIDGGDEDVFNDFVIDVGMLDEFATNVLAVEIHQRSAGSSDISFDLELLVTDEVVLVAKGAEWKYLDDGSDQGTTWQRGERFRRCDLGTRAPPSWATATATRPPSSTAGPAPATCTPKYITTYFRHSFNGRAIPRPRWNGAFIRDRCCDDDGAVVYLNGTEVFRSNIPDLGAVDSLTCTPRYRNQTAAERDHLLRQDVRGPRTCSSAERPERARRGGPPARRPTSSDRELRPASCTESCVRRRGRSS